MDVDVSVGVSVGGGVFVEDGTTVGAGDESASVPPQAPINKGTIATINQ